MGVNLLIVDDDEIVVFLHRLLIVKSGLSPAPIPFHDGKAAFDYLNAHFQEGEGFLILLDINMSVMDGWGFLDSIQSTPFAKQVSVVMVTSSINSADQDKAKQYEQVVGFMEKPLTPEACEQIKGLAKVARVL